MPSTGVVVRPTWTTWCWAFARALFDTLSPVVANIVLHQTRIKLRQRARHLMRPELGRPPTTANMPRAGRYRAKRVIVYHESSGAAKTHAEAYLDDGRRAYNVGVKRLPAPLKRNGGGRLTRASQEEVLAILKREFAQRGYIAQSTDHTGPQSRAEWFRTEDGPKAYGRGPIRQVISETEVEVLSDGNKAVFTDWVLNPRQMAYVFKIMQEGDLRSKNILSLGFKKSTPPNFEDRLHLKFDQDVEKFLRNVDRQSLKIDGASTHFVVDRDGLRAYSPRFSVETGQRIEYTAKLGNLQDVRMPVRTIGMGELVFRYPGAPILRLCAKLGLHRALKMLVPQAGELASASEIGGILNARRLPPKGMRPEIYVYRVDKVGRTDVVREPYWEQNRARCAQMARLHNRLLVPRELTSDEVRTLVDEEGAVGVPAGESILEAGRKIKLRPEYQDGVVETIGFHPGPSGRVAGVISYRDDKNGCVYKTASGFKEELKRDMMEHPRRYLGRTMVLRGFNGHAGRAAKFDGFKSDAKFVDFHLDK